MRRTQIVSVIDPVVNSVRDAGTLYHVDSHCESYPDNAKRELSMCQICRNSSMAFETWLEDRHISVTWVASRHEDAKEADWLGKGHHGYSHLPSLSLAAGSTTWLELETSVPEVTPKAVFHTTSQCRNVVASPWGGDGNVMASGLCLHSWWTQSICTAVSSDGW